MYFLQRINMKKLIILLTGLTIFLINIACAEICIHRHDTHNVGHQFYDALIETPKDALVKGAHATKDLASTVVKSDAAHDLKDAAKELIIEAPIKTAYAIKNGTVKVYDATKRGVKTVYHVAVEKPALAIKEAAHTVANSQVVQGTKEAIVEVGEQFAEVGHDMVDATKYGAQKAYKVAIEKPVGAVKAAAHYLAHGEEPLVGVAECEQEVCVMVLQTPSIANRALEYGDAQEQLNLQVSDAITTVSVMPATFADISSRVVTNEHDQQVGVEFIIDTPCLLTENADALSIDTLRQIEKTYNAIKADLTHQK